MRVLTNHQTSPEIYLIQKVWVELVNTFFKIFALLWQILGKVDVYGHTMLNTPVLVRSLKLSNIGLS